MHLKISFDEAHPKHKDAATCATWSNVDEVYTCGDDHVISMWNLMKNETQKVVELPAEAFPISMQWLPKNFSTPVPGSRKSTELLILTTSDGYFHLMTRAGRIEKSVPAHKGAVISGTWNPEGTEILTSGEDGCLRVWSRSGVMRSCLAQISIPIYSSAWSPDAQNAIYTNGQNLVIKPISSNSPLKPIQWKAHDGIILCLAWSASANLIVSGAEDCRYKVWDADGHQVFGSSQHDYPITAIAWTNSGDLFVVAGFNFLRLCDRYGWSHSLEKPKVGSIYSIQWSSDGSQLVGACASGHVFSATVINRTYAWQNLEVCLTGRKTLTVAEFTSNKRDKIDFPERISKISLKYGQLLVVTPSQVFVYNAFNISTPFLCELRDHNQVTLVVQSAKTFMLCCSLAITCWNYGGKQEGIIKWPGLRGDLLNSQTATISSDMAAFVDQADPRLIRVFYTTAGKALTELRMKLPVQQVALAQTDDPMEKMLAIVDQNSSLSLAIIKRGMGMGSGGSGGKDLTKGLSMMTSGVIWHSDSPILATIRKTKLRVYYMPQVVFTNTSLLEDTLEDKDLGDFGPAPQLVSYDGGCVQIRRSSGVLLTTQTSPFIPRLHSLINAGKFLECQRICRYVNEKLLWGVLGGLAAWKGQLELAEVCYCESGHYDKVMFIHSIRSSDADDITKKSQEQLLTGGGTQEAELILMQQNRVKEAVALHIWCHNWMRALELSLKHNEGVEDVIIARSMYLHNLNTPEFHPKFKELQSKYKLSTKGMKRLETEKKNRTLVASLRQKEEKEREETTSAIMDALAAGGSEGEVSRDGSAN